MTDPTRLLAAAAFLCMAVIVIGWWRAEVRADRAEVARDTAIVDCANATALANQHWRDLQRARAQVAAHERWGDAFRQVREAEHWATVPRETPDSNAGGHSASIDPPTVPLPAHPLPIAKHYETGGWGGLPGECGVECACGTTFDGFDTIAEAAALLGRHIAAEQPTVALPTVPGRRAR